MIRIAGVLGLLLLLYSALYHSGGLGGSNLKDVANRQGFAGVVTLGVAVLIITGSIDLSIGSVVGLSAIVFGMLMRSGYPPILAMFAVIGMGMTIGLIHGLLVTQMKLQAFLVTLCGLFVYRGIARYLTNLPVGMVSVRDTVQPDPSAPPSFAETQLQWMEFLLVGKDKDLLLVMPSMLFVLIALALVLAVVLHASIFGRFWYAIGYNESAARYAGIHTNTHRLVGFVISSALASFAGVLWLLDTRSADPNNAGEFLELYAITGAVLGGCSLRGGEGTVIGMVLGAAVLPLLRNVVSFQGIPDAIIPAVIGLTLLFGTIADEFFRRRSALRK